MTLYEYISKSNDEEITVWDKDYDIETYFYKNDEPSDTWDKSMNDLSKLLEVAESNDRGVSVNLAEVIERNIDKLDDLFIDCDIDSIMDDIENILAGNVSEKWIEKFVAALQ